MKGNVFGVDFDENVRVLLYIIYVGVFDCELDE